MGIDFVLSRYTRLYHFVMKSWLGGHPQAG
jgi:hypothetical protein